MCHGVKDAWFSKWCTDMWKQVIMWVSCIRYLGTKTENRPGYHESFPWPSLIKTYSFSQKDACMILNNDNNSIHAIINKLHAPIRYCWICKYMHVANSAVLTECEVCLSCIQWGVKSVINRQQFYCLVFFQQQEFKKFFTVKSSSLSHPNMTHTHTEALELHNHIQWKHIKQMIL